MWMIIMPGVPANAHSIRRKTGDGSLSSSPVLLRTMSKMTPVQKTGDGSAGQGTVPKDRGRFRGSERQGTVPCPER